MAGAKDLLMRVVDCTVRAWFWVTSPLFRWVYGGSHRNLPAVDNPLLLKSAVELARMIRSRQVKSVDVVRAFIERIDVVNYFINAVVADRFKDAIAEALDIDEVLDSGNIPDKYSEENAPFLGVPFTAKEAISIAGLPHTCGLLQRRDVIAERDADAIICLRRAGGIPLAVTNISELCMWYESNNLIYGRSYNPYHQGRTVGGSSGGEGCLISAGGSPIGIGSDDGGSIRMPAFFNGIFGHKCSPGLVSYTGHYPEPKAGGKFCMSIGPMSRFSCDLLPIFNTMVLPDQRNRLRLDEKVDVRKLRYFYMEDDGGSLLVSPVHHEVKNAVRKAAQHFEQLGCMVQKVNITQLKQSFDIWAAVNATSGEESACLLLGNNVEPINPCKELLLWSVGRGRHIFPALGLGLFEKMENSAEENAAMILECEKMKKIFNEMLGDDSVFLYPAHPLPAPYHNQPIIVLFNFAYTAIFSILGLPVTSVPMGIARNESVPVGIQVVASPYNDRLCFAVSSELETAFRGWQPPFEVKQK